MSAATKPIENPEREVRAISLHQPWATLVAVGEKLNETRGWATRWVGPLFIHATRLPADELAVANPLIQQALARHGYYCAADLPTGCILARCELARCVQLTAPGIEALSRLERAVGAYGPGRWAWELTGVMQLETPVDVPGRQGLWIPEPDIIDRVLADRGVR